METKTADKPVPWEVAALLSSERLILRETNRAATPFGGVAVFVSFLRKIDLVGQLRQHMPVRWKSLNQIDPTDCFVALYEMYQDSLELKKRLKEQNKAAADTTKILYQIGRGRTVADLKALGYSVDQVRAGLYAALP